jgi:predicted peroxiredoxin
MQILYVLTSGTSDPNKASLPVHLAVNGSHEIGDDVAIVIAGDGTEFVAAGAIEAAEGVGVPAMRELFAKVLEYEIPVHV